MEKQFLKSPELSSRSVVSFLHFDAKACHPTANPSHIGAATSSILQRISDFSYVLRRVSHIPAAVGRALIRLYRYTLSPLIGFHCRHLPTCSEYSDQAIGRFGLWAGGWITVARLCRCQPWGTHGLDFVCDALPRESRWYMPWRYGRWRGTNAGPQPQPDQLSGA